MRLRQKRCPAPAMLERAFWSEDPDVREHVEGCIRCAEEWTEIRLLVDAGRALAPAAGSPAQREELRTQVLAYREPAARERSVAWGWRLAAPLASAAAVALLWWLWPGPAVRLAPVAGTAQRASVLVHEGARYLPAAPRPDEIVRLVDGTVSVDVAAALPGERFRVFTGDAEVEALGAAFDVTARADRLVSVRVIYGAVEVRGLHERHVITAGQTWLAAASRSEAPAPPTAPPAVIAAAPGPPAPAREAPARTPLDPQPARTTKETPDRDATPDAAPAPAVEPVTDEPEPSPPAPPRSPAQQAFDDGWEALRAGDFARAAAALELAMSTDDAGLAEDASFWRAVALARGKRADAAIRAFELYLGRYPASVRAGEANVALGWLLLERGARDAAIDRFLAALDDPLPRVRKSAAEGLKAAR